MYKLPASTLIFRLEFPPKLLRFYSRCIWTRPPPPKKNNCKATVTVNILSTLPAFYKCRF